MVTSRLLAQAISDVDDGVSVKSRFKNHFREDLGLKFRSSWEANYARYLNYRGIEWKYEEEYFETLYGKYTPDFYLPREDKYIEVKGKDQYYSLQNQKIRWLRKREIIIEIIDFMQYGKLVNRYSIEIPNWE